MNFLVTQDGRRRAVAKGERCKKSWQHTSFPSGPPPQYSSCLKPFNFGVRMGSGAFGLVWPTAKLYPPIRLKYPATSARRLPTSKSPPDQQQATFVPTPENGLTEGFAEQREIAHVIYRRERFYKKCSLLCAAHCSFL